MPATTGGTCDTSSIPENPKLADAEYAERWLRGEYQFMNQHEQEEYLVLYRTRKQRKAIKERRKASGRAHGENG